MVNILSGGLHYVSHQSKESCCYPEQPAAGVSASHRETYRCIHMLSHKLISATCLLIPTAPHVLSSNPHTLPVLLRLSPPHLPKTLSAWDFYTSRSCQMDYARITSKEGVSLVNISLLPGAFLSCFVYVFNIDYCVSYSQNQCY